MLSWSASQALKKSYNEYLLYILGYQARGPAVQRGLEIHENLERAARGEKNEAAKLLDQIANELGSLVGVEVSIESKEATMHGRADALFLGDGLTVCDYKTGRKRDADLDQLHWYGYCFASWGVIVTYVAACYIDPKNLIISGIDNYFYDDVRGRRLARLAKDQIAFLRETSPPRRLIVPVHGTKADEETQRRISKIPSLEGLSCKISEREVETEQGSIVGKEILFDGVHLGWVPDVLKTRINATACEIFAHFHKDGHRSAGLRVAVPMSDISFEGIENRLPALTMVE